MFTKMKIINKTQKLLIINIDLHKQSFLDSGIFYIKLDIAIGIQSNQWLLKQ